uniref:Putative methyltransferase n=1 Tax=viral metagenome TaxID=1070528 RepID=A0A6H1Z8H5_9ZZZZ
MEHGKSMREPVFIDGKPYVELYSYGLVNPMGHCAANALEHFKGRNDLMILEIGILRGHNAEVLDKAFHPRLMVLVDPWDVKGETNDNNWAETWYRVQGKPNIVVIKATSETAARILNLNFDYVYLDGDHTGGDLSAGSEDGGIRLDIRLWLPKVNKGGIISGHDYNFDNIKSEVHKVFGDRVNTSPYHPHGGMEWWVYV